MSGAARADAPPPWLQAIGPNETPQVGSIASGVDAWHVAVAFEPWLLGVHGALEDPRDAYRRTPLRTALGELTIAEVELVDRLRTAGWHAGWLDAFGGAPLRWRARLWTDAELPDATHALFAAVGERVGNRWRGRADVVAWHPDAPHAPVYLHYKGARDPMRGSQAEWVAAAFAAGLPCERYALVRWWG